MIGQLGGWLPMTTVTYFIQGASGKCPKCPSKRYTGSTKLSADTKITCVRCGEVRTIRDALRSSMKMRGLKKLGPKKPL